MVSKQVEIVARALARHRLAYHHRISPNLVPSVAAAISRAEERLWPALTDEAQAVLAAMAGWHGGNGINDAGRATPASPKPPART